LAKRNTRPVFVFHVKHRAVRMNAAAGQRIQDDVETLLGCSLAGEFE